jgi:hypothetical protein
MADAQAGQVVGGHVELAETLHTSRTLAVRPFLMIQLMGWTAYCARVLGTPLPVIRASWRCMRSSPQDASSIRRISSAWGGDRGTQATSCRT